MTADIADTKYSNERTYSNHSSGMQMRKTSELSVKHETLRKSFHLFVLLLPFLPLLIPLVLMKIFFFFGWLMCFPIEAYRLTHPNLWINRVTRLSEQKGLANYPFTIGAWTIIILGVNVFYPYFVAVLAITPFMLGDATAAIIGKRYGQHRFPFWKKKTIEGWIAGMTLSFLLALWILSLMNPPLIYTAVIPPLLLGLYDLPENLPHWYSDNVGVPLLTVVFVSLFML